MIGTRRDKSPAVQESPLRTLFSWRAIRPVADRPLATHPLPSIAAAVSLRGWLGRLVRIALIEVFGYDLTYVHGSYVMSGDRVTTSLQSTVVRVVTDEGIDGWG